MPRAIDPNSIRQKLLAVSRETGIPINVLFVRHYADKPLDAPYVPRLQGEHRKLAAKAFREAVKNKAKKYTGGPCGRCGGFTRYTSSRTCVACNNGGKK